MSPYAVAPDGGEVRLGLHVRLEPGWHIYWKNSGDAGYPPAVTLSGAPLGDARILWPAPERYELPGGLVAFGYEDEVVYPLRARWTARVSGRVEIAADVDYVVCEVDCIPFRAQLALAQPVGEEPAPDPRAAPLLAGWEARVPRAVEELAGVETRGMLRRRGGAPVLEVWVDGIEPAAAGAGLFFEPHEELELGRPEARATDEGVAWRVPVSPLQADRPLPERAVLAWTATGLARGG
ncbi:MAG TPA: protein-disulfide reductase DsbD domain-containing protein, partial [Thermoanaerobaculia bacterium]|nr:protein-disulfide reductase DsbD domain-containing protein [Thermoanaerobaculia bacterium]